MLAFESRHSLAVEKLPKLRRDPFDRLLIAQALVDDLAIVTRDLQFEQYSVPVVRC